MPKQKGFSFFSWRAVLFCGALLFPLITRLDCAHADDDNVGEPPAANNGDNGDDDDQTAVIAPRIGAHEPSAKERNSQESAVTLKLAANGQPLLPIVIATKASAETRRCALELGDYLQRITGAKFVFQTPDGKTIQLPPVKPTRLPADIALDKQREAMPAEALPGTGIVVGNQNEFKVPALVEALQIHGGFDGREAFAVRTSAKQLLLIGASDVGTRHAVNRFLETLGCRWLATGANWEIIPSISNLNWNRDITDRPTIATRNIAFMDGAMSDETIDGKVFSERAAQAKWSRRNDLGGSLGASAGHAWHRIFADFNDEFVAHPEYFAEVDGKRMQPLTKDRTGKVIVNGVFAKLELGNPRVREMVLESARRYFQNNPDADVMSFSPTDGGGFSQSPESQKLGTVSDAVYGMANDIAKMLQKEFPGKMVGVYAYRETAEPPSFPLEPNVYIEMTTLYNMSKYSYAELFDMWRKAARNLGFYEYFSFFDADYSHLPGSRAGSVEFIKKQMPFYAGLNAAVISAQSSNAFGAHGRGYYLASKLMWNPNLDADTILNDYYEKAYGAAAVVMKRYHERVSRDADTILTDNLMGAALRDVDEATRLAKDRPDVLARLSDIKQYLHYEILWRKAGSLPARTPEEKAAYREAVVAAIRHAYAMRHSYMVQWNMVADRSGRPAAATLQDISLITKNKRKTSKFEKIPGDPDVPNVWEGTPTESPEEIEINFQNDLKGLPTNEIEDKKFNLNDLVPVNFPKSALLPVAVTAKDSGPRADYYQSRTAHYVFYSFKGEPIQFKLQAGRRFTRGDSTWTLTKTSATGATQVIEQGAVASDKQEYPLSIKVPGSGAYVLDVDFRNQGGVVIYDTTKPAGVTWAKTGSGAKGLPGPFFYVPKGTKEIQYFFQSNNGGASLILQPDGKEAARVAGAGSGEVAFIPVPAGMDGKVWRVSPKSTFRTQRFFNIPNVVAVSPESLLVPREVAEKDGLSIRTQ